MKRVIKNLISVSYTALRFAIIKVFHWSGFKSSLIERFSPNVVIEVGSKAELHVGKRVRVHSGCKLLIRENAKLIISNNVMANYNCIFACRDSISIGSGTIFGPSVYIYDHDHDYRSGLAEVKYVTAPVTIGKNCWIGANTVILRGSVIGDNCVIGAGCVVSGKIPDNSVYVQKRAEEIKKLT